MYHIFFIHSSVDGHLGCFHVLTIVNSAAMNIRVHVSFRIIVFSGYMPRSGIAGSYGNSIFIFFRNLHTVLHNGCTNFFTNHFFLMLLLTSYCERLEFSSPASLPHSPTYNHTHIDIIHFYHNSGFSTDYLLHFKYYKYNSYTFVSSSTHSRPYTSSHRSTC